MNKMKKFNISAILVLCIVLILGSTSVLSFINFFGVRNNTNNLEISIAKQDTIIMNQNSIIANQEILYDRIKIGLENDDAIFTVACKAAGIKIVKTTPNN